MELRDTNIKRLKQTAFDVLVIGGGINGAVAAAALAAKGVEVALIDQGDFASDTSSNSSNLAWGGIKYLESHDYGLVNKLCKSRNHLMQSYPSTVQEIRFLTTVQRGFRWPVALVYLGTLMYWAMGRFLTKAPKYLRPRQIKTLEPCINTDNAVGGFEYSDCFLHDNDARFVFNFIRRGMDNGCTAGNYLKAIASKRADNTWQTRVRDQLSGAEFTFQSAVVINACGPQVDIFNQQCQQHTQHRHLFSKGVHLIVDRIARENKVLAFFASDGRLFFVIPMGQKTCIGTTDEQVDNPQTTVTDRDRHFILDNANRLLDLANPLTEKNIIAERCGVRPLAVKGDDSVADWVQLSRKHAIDVDAENGYLSIFGGKLTDCLNVGEEVVAIVDQLGIPIPTREATWYGESPLEVKQAFSEKARQLDLDRMTPAYSSEPLSQRLWRRYDAKAMQILEAIERDPSQAHQLIHNAEYIKAEVCHAARWEMVTKLEDFLRRRSKISMVLRKEGIISAPGLKDACQILFGPEADAKLEEYRHSNVH